MKKNPLWVDYDELVETEREGRNMKISKNVRNLISRNFKIENVNLTIQISGIERYSEKEEITEVVMSKIRKLNNDRINDKIQYKITLDSN